MRDLNAELVRKLASKCKKRPPNEAMRRLQLELPLVFGPVANDAAPALPLKQKKKRGPKTRHAHGRPELPAHLPRIPEVYRMDDKERVCPNCNVETKHIGFKTTEKLDIKPAEFIVRQVQCETVGCRKCHEYIRSASKPDEVVDRGLLGDELLVQALVDHYDDAVPFERMARNAKQQNVPLSANTLASSVGRLVDLFDPIVAHIREARDAPPTHSRSSRRAGSSRSSRAVIFATRSPRSSPEKSASAPLLPETYAQTLAEELARAA